jgi:hypothetical protein
MARASAKRAKRARSNARNAQRAVAQEAPVAAAAAAPEPVRRPKPAPPKQEAPRRSFLSRSKKPPKQKRPEDTMFFTRLRTHTKWVFVLLAATFAIGFLAFGVGAGGTGVGDFIRDLFGGDSGTVTLSDLQKKVDENPNDGEAVTQLAALLASQQQYGRATTTLEKYLEAKPNDDKALEQLASVYDARAADAAQQAASQQSAAFEGSFAGAAFAFPSSSGFFGALGQNPIFEATNARVSAEAQELTTESTGFYAKEASTLERLTKIRPDDATLYAQLGSASQQASQGHPAQLDNAIAAYEKYLELEPDGPLAEQVKEQLNGLKAAQEASTGDVVQG